MRRALQAKAPRLRVQPETVRHSEVQFLHLYVVVEWKNGKKFMTLVRQDEPDERILSPEMKTAWNKVDRTKLKHAIFAPTSRRLGKTAEESMEEELIEAYNQKRIPREWLKLGAKFGEVISARPARAHDELCGTCCRLPARQRDRTRAGRRHAVSHVMCSRFRSVVTGCVSPHRCVCRQGLVRP